MFQINWFSTPNNTRKPLGVEVVTSRDEIVTEPEQYRHCGFKYKWWIYYLEVTEVETLPTQAQQNATKCRLEAIRLNGLYQTCEDVRADRDNVHKFGLGEISGPFPQWANDPAWTAMGFELGKDLMLKIPGKTGIGSLGALIHSTEEAPPKAGEIWVYNTQDDEKGAQKVRTATESEIADARLAVERYAAHYAECEAKLATMDPGCWLNGGIAGVWAQAWQDWLQVHASGRQLVYKENVYDHYHGILGELCPYLR